MTDPFDLFDAWYREARETEINDSNAMALATADAEGRPSVSVTLHRDGHDATQSSVSRDLRELGVVKGGDRYLLPAVFPSFVTGAITASGGSWNAAIVAEFVTWAKARPNAKASSPGPKAMPGS